MLPQTLTPWKFFIFILIIKVTKTSTINPDTEFTQNEIKALAEIKILGKEYLRADYEKLDGYLIHFLRSRDLDVKKTKIMLEENAKWRRSMRMDSILEEPEMLRMSKLFPHSFQQFDKGGRPVLTYALEKWDVRKIALAGDIQKYQRFEWYMHEKANTRVWELALAGKNISQYVSLVDLSGFNFRQHVCLPCLVGASDSMRLQDERYPNMAFKVIFINTPRTFFTFLRAFGLQEILNPRHKDVLKFFGFDKSEWRPYLSTLINDDQLLLRYGGKILGNF